LRNLRWLVTLTTQIIHRTGMQVEVAVEMAASTHSMSAKRLSTNHSERREIEALKEENRQLRELVIYLSKLVIRNVTDQK
jgi:hypothetical protein